jgi:hypothetical protein
VRHVVVKKAVISFFPIIKQRIKLTLGLLVEVSEVLPLLLVDDGEDSGNGLSDSVARLSVLISQIGSCGPCDLPSPWSGLDILLILPDTLSPTLSGGVSLPLLSSIYTLDIPSVQTISIFHFFDRASKQTTPTSWSTCWRNHRQSSEPSS